MRSLKEDEDAPYITTVRRTIPNLSGELLDIRFEPTSLHLRIGEGSLILMNVDDELEIVVNGEPISESIYRRTD
jgi:hypothetical protein